MDNETAANPAGADDTRVDDTASAVTEGAQTPAEGTASTEQPQVEGFDDLLPPEEEYAEIEVDGAKYKVPAPLKDGYLRQSDYTRKTMEAAELRKQASAAQQRYETLSNLTAAEVRATTNLETIQGELAQLEQIPWATLDHSDPKVQQAKGRRDELARQAANLRAALNEHFSLKAQQEQQQSAKFREETDAQAAKIIKDWSPEKRSALEAFAVSQGIPQELAGQATAAEFKLLNLAHIGAQFIERQRAAARANAQNAAKPAAEVAGGSAGAGTADPARMSMDEYIAARNAGKL